MKTPQRYQNKPLPLMPEDSTIDDMVTDIWCQRAKRKNRVKILKNTISMLRRRLKDTEETLRLTQQITKCFIVKPDHWHHLDENGNELPRKQWLIKRKKEEAFKKGVQE